MTRNVKISDSRILNDGIINITSLSLQLNERCKGIPFSILMQLREEHRLRVIVNEVLGNIFRSERQDVTGTGRKLLSKNLH